MYRAPTNEGKRRGRMRACGKAVDGSAPLWVWWNVRDYTSVRGNGASGEGELPERTGERRA